MTGEPLAVRFMHPPEDMADWFTSLYYFDAHWPDGGEAHDYLQPEWSNLRFFERPVPLARMDQEESGASDFVVSGPSSRAAEFRLPSTRMWGVGLMPLGWARIAGVDASGWANRTVPGGDDPVFAPLAGLARKLFAEGASVEKQYEVLVAALRSCAHAVRDAGTIRDVHRAMVDPLVQNVTDFAQATGLSTRTLERVCNRHFGFSPSLLLRRQRFMRSLANYMLSPGKAWSDVIDGNYHDQAHFVREFHAFMGMSPSEYAALDHPVMAAFMKQRQETWGSPVQTLDKPKRKQR